MVAATSPILAFSETVVHFNADDKDSSETTVQNIQKEMSIPVRNQWKGILSGTGQLESRVASSELAEDQQKTTAKTRDNRFHLSDMLQHRISVNLSQQDKMATHDPDGWSPNLTCEACKVIVKQLQDQVAQQKTTDEFIKVAIDICKTYKVEDDRVCDLVVPLYSEMVLSVLRGTVLDPHEVCGIVLGDTCATPFYPSNTWNITISDIPKPPVKPRTLPKPGFPTVRVLHLTDIHVDIEYREGADAECGEPLCCRAFDINPAPNASRAAGRWGDYRHCDMPLGTLESLFQHLSFINADQFDYVIFTGDIPAHDVWNQTQIAQLTNLQRLSGLFRKYLPNTPVYVAMGNHESVPCNSFPTDETSPDESMAWLYSAVLQAWGYWLPTSTYQTIMRGGFYTFSPFPGFRIVSLNSNYGASLNWWLFLNDTDPQGQLQWLADVLQDAEDKGEKVQILSHFPPGETLKAFSWNYYRLVNRYESTIVGQFHGHTHKDEFQVFYDLQNRSRAVGVSYIGGSVTPYSELNSAYRIYTLDGNYPGSSWEVLDYTHYYFDLAKANKGLATSWRKEYSPKEGYQMKNLYPEEWDRLIYRMRDNDTLFQMYNTFYYKSSGLSPCTDWGCKLDKLCKIKQARADDSDICKDI